ncbi:hypothetical protein AB835_03710 [Candidatus Endobugula sertula]|uniref:PilZ domain-containing protein n=1 Tax=Candidatus Endobugula sertula TaxID=62101 RepID=A0A1D2QS70_9GAMM|nr:hypothetical protein AB835_03710 [Candidatus Endobugula sertula]
MLLTMDQKLPLGSELLVTLCPENGQRPTLQAKCTIARLQQAGGDKCLLGLEILEVLSEADSTQVA